jgi:hypothetical protein
VPATHPTYAKIGVLEAIVGIHLSRPYLRKYPRVNVRVPVHYTVGEKSSRCHAIKMSGGGLFLTEIEELELGKELTVRFRPAKHLPVIAAKAFVRYQVPGQGIAIEFAEINSQDQSTLLRMIHQKTGDRRLTPRAPLATQVECEGSTILAFSRDVSIGGMFVELTTPPPVGQQVNVRFHLDDSDKVVKAVGHVAYHVEKMGMAIRFEEMAPQDLLAIEDYVARMISTTPAESEKARPSP